MTRGLTGSHKNATILSATKATSVLRPTGAHVTPSLSVLDIGLGRCYGPRERREEGEKSTKRYVYHGYSRSL